MIYLVTSDRPHEGKTTTAYKKAVDDHLLFIDADLRGSLLLNKKYGLTDCLLKIKTIKDCIYSTDKLTYIPAGYKKTITNEIFEEPFQNVINELLLDYKNIIIDTPPLHYFSDAIKLAKYCDSIIYVKNKNEPVCAKLPDTLNAPVNIVETLFIPKKTNFNILMEEIMKNNSFKPGLYRIINAPKHVYVQPKSGTEYTDLLNIGDTFTAVSEIGPWLKTNTDGYVFGNYGKYAEFVE